MSYWVIAGVAGAVVVVSFLLLFRLPRSVLVPVVLLLGVAGLTFAVQWQKEEQRQAAIAAQNASYDKALATLEQRREQARTPTVAPAPVRRPNTPTGF